jgi:hypothetical protein
MTDSEIRTAYWAHEMGPTGMVWGHRNIIKYLGEHGVSVTQMRAAITEETFTAPCGACGVEAVLFGTKNRTALLQAVEDVGLLRCKNCREKERAEQALAEQRWRETEVIEHNRRVAEKLARRESRRGAVALRYGELFTGEPCPECMDGYLVIKLSSASTIFVGCSSWNPHKSTSCHFMQSLAPELRKQYLDVFRRRLDGVFVPEDTTAEQIIRRTEALEHE